MYVEKLPTSKLPNLRPLIPQLSVSSSYNDLYCYSRRMEVIQGIAKKLSSKLSCSQYLGFFKLVHQFCYAIPYNTPMIIGDRHNNFDEILHTCKFKSFRTQWFCYLGPHAKV